MTSSYTYLPCFSSYADGRFYKCHAQCFIAFDEMTLLYWALVTIKDSHTGTRDPQFPNLYTLIALVTKTFIQELKTPFPNTYILQSSFITSWPQIATTKETVTLLFISMHSVTSSTKSIHI